MNGLDIDALMKKNPQVNQGVIRERLEKNKEASKAPEPNRGGGSTSPYGGRRVVADDSKTGSSGKHYRSGWMAAPRIIKGKVYTAAWFDDREIVVAKLKSFVP